MKKWPIPLPPVAVTLLVLLVSAISLSGQTNNYKVLVFSKTAAFRHDGSIAAGTPMIQERIKNIQLIGANAVMSYE